MKRALRWKWLALAFFSASVGAAGPHGHATPPSSFSSAMDAGMAKMMEAMHASGYTGNADIDFLAMMIPHHEGAVEMARQVLIHGRDPHTRRLAEDIIASQTIEIEGMKRRLAVLRGEARSNEDDFPALGGTRGPEE